MLACASGSINVNLPRAALTQTAHAVVTPRTGSPTREVIKRIVMRFGEDERYLSRLEVTETGGDTMSIAFSNPNLNPALAREEWDPRHE